MKHLFLLLIILWTSLLSAPNTLYKELYSELENDIVTANKMKDVTYFKPFSNEINALERCLVKADKVLVHKNKNSQKHYLKQLRSCSKKSKKLDAHYVKALRKAIGAKDMELFKVLIEADPRVLRKELFTKKSVAFYKKNNNALQFEAGARLVAEYEKDDHYRQMAATEMANYEANVKVQSYDKARHSRDKNGKVRTFFVGYKRVNGQILLIAENKNAYAVTVSVALKNLTNYTVDRRPPYHMEIDPYSKQTLMTLRVQDRHKKSRVGWQYSWVMGRESARHDNNYIYALPFKKGATVIVSQGFNGQATHTGRSRYAVDFVADVGTPIYAARGGHVVAVEGQYNKGGFGKEFGQYANYIDIEHTDHTIGKYYHLKQDGVNVKVGQFVSRGQLIGWSGNTGYSSGPHLHFGVYKVDSDFRHSVSLPFKFQTNRGVVDAPKKGDIFRAVR